MDDRRQRCKRRSNIPKALETRKIHLKPQINAITPRGSATSTRHLMHADHNKVAVTSPMQKCPVLNIHFKLLIAAPMAVVDHQVLDFAPIEAGQSLCDLN